MFTVGSLAIVMSLLGMAGVFALLALDDKRRAESGSPGTVSDVKQERAPGLDSSYFPAAVYAGCQETPVSEMTMASGPSAPSLRNGPSDLWS